MGDSSLRGKYHVRKPLKVRTSRKIRFFFVRTHGRTQLPKKHVFRVARFSVASADQHSKSLHALREAGTLPRSPRIKWGAGTPDAPLQVPSGTESMLMNAALASVHASSSRRLAVRLRMKSDMKRSGDELPLCTWSGCGGRLRWGGSRRCQALVLQGGRARYYILNYVHL